MALTNKFSSNRPTGPIRSSSRDVRVSVCQFVPFHVVYFEAYFAPTSQSRKSKNFRDSESLGEKCWKEVVSELLGCGLKSPRKKTLFADFALQNMVETTLPNGLETSGRMVYC